MPNWICVCHFSLIVLPLVLGGQRVQAQGSREDYQRAAELGNRLRDLVPLTQMEPHWYGERDSRFWYRRALGKDTWQYVSVDSTTGHRTDLFEAQDLARALSEQRKRPVDPERLPLENLVVRDDGNLLQFRVERDAYEYRPREHQLSRVPAPDDEPNRREPGRRPQRRSTTAPDQQTSVLGRDHNLILKRHDTGELIPLTRDGTAENPYDAAVFWSPDSSSFVAIRTERAQSHPIHLIESSPRDQVQPKLHTLEYLKPGDRIAHPRLYLFDVRDLDHTSALRPENVSCQIADSLFPDPWSLADIRWNRDGREFTFIYNQRGHQILRILAVDARTRAVRMLVEEVSPTFVDYAGKFFVEPLEDSGELIWMSERSGWNHLYLYDTRLGTVRNAITQGEWVVRGVEHVDRHTRQVTFRASGVFADQDPYYVHVGRVNFDGTDLVWLTEGDGTHSVVFSPGRETLVDTWSRVDLPPVIELRRVSDGTRVAELERADDQALREAGWRPPERFTAKGRDGQTDIYGVIWRPTTFDPAKKYPVLESIYAGPHSAFVPKAFSAFHGYQMPLAELGFVVVQIDGMGTSHRSKAFHDVCWKNLGDSGFPDRIAWLRAAAAKFPEMDLERVGIYGGSAGGQSALRALLAHGDFYEAAVADCGCHDNRMDKIWWNELWMGYPVGPHYAEQSNVTQAHRLKGKLLLVVGELDRNVDPASTMQVVDALVRADKDFELLVIPGAGHGAAESPYGKRRRMDFFVRHLWNQEPRHSTP